MSLAVVLSRGLAGVEAPLGRDAIVYPAPSLLGVCAHVTGRSPLAPLEASPPSTGTGSTTCPHLIDVGRQDHPKRALTIAAAGSHNLLIL